MLVSLPHGHGPVAGVPAVTGWCCGCWPRPGQLRAEAADWLPICDTHVLDDGGGDDVGNVLGVLVLQRLEGDAHALACGREDWAVGRRLQSGGKSAACSERLQRSAQAPGCTIASGRPCSGRPLIAPLRHADAQAKAGLPSWLLPGPRRAPRSLKAGPPLLPLLIAASTCGGTKLNEQRSEVVLENSRSEVLPPLQLHLSH